jgi:chromosome segregation ATPase
MGTSDETISPGEAARFLGVSEEEARELADSGGRVRLEEVRSRAGAAALARELARTREEIGTLKARLKETRETNLRLQREAREANTERRRLTEEVLELRAAAEERLMLMERIEHIAYIEQELEEVRAELEELRGRGLLARLLNR